MVDYTMNSDSKSEMNQTDNPLLTTCKDCCETVSVNAKKCPHCGTKLKQDAGDHIVNFIIAIVILVVILFIFSLIRAG